MEHFRALVHVPARGKNHKNTEKYDRKSTRYEMLSSERPPQMLHKRRRSGKDKSWASSTGVTTLEDIVHGPESQVRSFGGTYYLDRIPSSQQYVPCTS